MSARDAALPPFRSLREFLTTPNAYFATR